MAAIRTVTVSGYYGWLNAGDDALAATVCWGLNRTLHPRTVLVLSGTPLVLPAGIPARFTASGRLGQVQACWRSVFTGLHVMGGGSVFHDRTDLRVLQRELRLTRLAAAVRTPTAGIGVSLGPLRTPEGARLLREILRRMRLVCVRDQRSLDLAREICPEAAGKVHLTFDPAVFLDRIGLPDPVTPPAGSGPIILVSPCDYQRIVWGDRGPDEARRQRLLQCLQQVCRRTGAFIRLLVMNGSPYFGDEETCRFIHAGLPPQRTELIPYDPNPLFAYRAIQGSQLVVGMRLHSLILGYAARVPLIGLDYHAKVRDFAKLVGLRESLLFDAHDLPVNELAEAIENALGRPKNEMLPTLDVDRAVQRAMEAFSLLGQALAAGASDRSGQAPASPTEDPL